MNGKVILITGGSRGIGAETAKLLASRGATSVINYISNTEAVERLVDDIQQAGRKAIAIQGDVRDANQVKSLVELTMSKLGQIDGLVSNAAMQFCSQAVLGDELDRVFPEAK